MCRENKLTRERALEDRLLEHKNIKVLHDSAVVNTSPNNTGEKGLGVFASHSMASLAEKHSIRAEGIFIAIGAIPRPSTFASLEK